MKGIFKTIIVSILALLSVALCVVFFIQGKQNHAFALEEQIKSANADIEVQEKRRVDLIYNLVDTVKEYDKHEANTLKDVVSGRKEDVSLAEVQTLLKATTESYPELKSNENYKTLMTELSVTENLIAEYRGNYNSQIKNYNRYVRKFPNKQFLNMLGYETINYDYLEYNAPSDAPQNLFGDKNGNN